MRTGDLPPHHSRTQTASDSGSLGLGAVSAGDTFKLLARRLAHGFRKCVRRLDGWLRRRRRRAWIAAALLLPVIYLAYCIATIPFAAGTPVPAASSAMVFQAADSNAFATRGVLKGEALSADRIPPLLAQAVVAVEDRRFYQHGSVDPWAIGRAAWHDLTGRRIEGGSTITQQLARRLYLNQERTLRRKVQEAALASWLELKFSKQEILARYLNAAYFGSGAYGADAAARRYFGKSAQQLSLSEAAMLAGLIRAPSQLEPDRNMAGAQDRAGTVLDAMVESGAISRQQADDAKRHPAELRVAPGTPPGNNYFIDAAAAEARSQAGATTADLTVKTTLDRGMQQIAESVIEKRLAAAGKSRNVGQAALVALAPDGAVLAMVGGRNYNTSQFNRVTQAHRQPGSLFKLFVYLTALRKGYTPDSVLVDQPVSIGRWEPDNYGDRFYGPVTLRTGFAHSLNSIAVQLAQSVGIDNVIATARQLGVRSDLPPVPSVALGSASVTLLEMTGAFANVAMNTTAIQPYTVREVASDQQAAFQRSQGAIQNKETLQNKNTAQSPTADDPAVHAEMMDLLASVVREGTGRAAALDQPVGGKTGTSEDYRDAWFVGFTSNMIVGVWVGNDDNASMNSVTGGSIPAAIWHDFVRATEAGRRPRTASGGPGFNGTISFGDNAVARPRQYGRDTWISPFRLFSFPRF